LSVKGKQRGWEIVPRCARSLVSAYQPFLTPAAGQGKIA
jgi:hypothetical protein